MDINDSVTGPRILLFAEYAATGGTRTYFKQLLALYAEKRMRVTVVRSYESEDKEIDSLCRQFGFQCVALSSVAGGARILRGKPGVRVLFEKLVLREFISQSDADLLVATVGTPELFLGAASCAKRSIYILHTYPHTSKSAIKSFLRKLLLAVFSSSATKILTVSQYSKNRILQTWGGWGRKLSIEVLYSTAGEAITPKARLTLSTLNVLTIGHVEAYKNPDVWIDVAIWLKENSPSLDVKFKWVGEGSRLDACRARVHALGAETYVYFMGRDDNVASHYLECDIYMQPSRIESLGLSVLDAMRHGRPCIVADTGGLPEVVCDGESGWVVDADDVREMANKVEMLARDSSLRKAMGQQAMRIYEDRFSHKRWSEMMWSIHEEMLQV